LTAVSRATLIWRIISTALVPDFGSALACPLSTARAGTLGVERVALARQTPQLAVGVIDLENRNRSPRPLPARYDQGDCKPEAP